MAKHEWIRYTGVSGAFEFEGETFPYGTAVKVTETVAKKCRDLKDPQHTFARADGADPEPETVARGLDGMPKQAEPAEEAVPAAVVAPAPSKADSGPVAPDDAPEAAEAVTIEETA